MDAAGDEEQGLGLKGILCTKSREFLVKNNGDQVKLEEQLNDKVVGLYFSDLWCLPCRKFNLVLSGIYKEINDSHGNKFEIVLVSADETEDSIQSFFGEVPWLAVPFSDSAACEHLNQRFKVRATPYLVLLDGRTGDVILNDALEVLQDYGDQAYPFTSQMVETLRKEEEEAKKNQSITTILASSSRNFVVSNNGGKVPVSTLEGKMVGIYFSWTLDASCRDFTLVLKKMREELEARGEGFHVVLVSCDLEKEKFDKAFGSMPWLAVPFGDRRCERLLRYFEVDTLPSLVVIGPDGKTIQRDVAGYVEDHGAGVHPFSPEKILELDEIDKARRESQTLESLLVSGELDYLLRKDGVKVPVKQLTGSTVLLYFAAHWCPPCQGSFTPKLVKVYEEIREKHGGGFEVIFVSSDTTKSSFEEYHSEMPWLALPFGDARKKTLYHKFKVQGIPTLVAIGASGRTLTTEARGHVMEHGANAFPFTDDRLRELAEEVERKAEGWPEKVKHELHEHPLAKYRRESYCCDECEEDGSGWSYHCQDCDFDMHPSCALEGGEATPVPVNGEAEAGGG